MTRLSLGDGFFWPFSDKDNFLNFHFDNKQFGEKGSASVVYGLGFCHFKGIFDLKICAVPNSLLSLKKSF